MVSAFKRKADENGTPFVEIDPSVCHYIENGSDSCVKEMFSRYVKNDGVVSGLVSNNACFINSLLAKTVIWRKKDRAMM